MSVDSPAPVVPAREPILVIEVVRTLVYAILIVMGVRTFLWQPFNIPSGSMTDTLLPGDYVWVNKFAYGYSRYSLPFGLPLFSGRIFGAEPQRGDIVVFKLPRDNKTDYIKRVVGLPGDHIQMRKGVLQINGAPVAMDYVSDFQIETATGPRTAKRYRETLPGGKVHDIIDTYEASRGDNTQEFVVPQGDYFMMGDNRDDSLDSRFSQEEGGVGFVPDENLEGRADAIFFSADGSAGFFEVWKWGAAVRWDRIFRSLQ